MAGAKPHITIKSDGTHYNSDILDATGQSLLLGGLHVTEIHIDIMPGEPVLAWLGCKLVGLDVEAQLGEAEALRLTVEDGTVYRFQLVKEGEE